MTTPLSIVLINLKPPYELKASTLRLASPGRTSTIQQILVAEEKLLTHDLLEIENSSSEQEPSRLPCTAETFREIFDKSHTVILPDSMFMENSRIFNNTLAFINHGMKALQTFYENGGTVLVQCVEGALSSTCAAQINSLFGTDWKVTVLADAITLGPTTAAKRLFESPYLPERIVIKHSAFFLSCPADEGLYQVVLPTREEFEKSFKEQDKVFERLGIEMDKSMDCFDVEKSWNDYLEKYSNRYGIAMHAHEKGGHVVWYGDRSQTNRKMSFVFCKLLHIGDRGFETEEIDKEKEDKKFVLSLGAPLVVILVVVLAILAKLALR